ncbi:phosphatase PAP2 family protein [Cupriavidus necator]|uniref:phosphatase PAP2 family protein n=1 Tax=Cupriavidus necator TaxID=106590 RepID=UPI00068DE484|nr:phosphatase PAP2 family protein [Cupriavidus necator]
MSEIEVAQYPTTLNVPIAARVPLSASACLNIAAWATLTVVAAVDYVWMQRAGFAVATGAIAQQISGLLIMAVSVLILRGISRSSRYSQLALRFHFREGCALVDALAVMMLFTFAALILQNLCVSLAPPVIDKELIALDAMVGFHWPDLYTWQTKHHFASVALSKVYLSYTYQVVFTIIVLGITKRTDDLADFVLLFMAAAVTVILISAPFPASNPMIHFGFSEPESPWSQFYALREGEMTVFDLDRGQGLISMPSLHAADAVLFAYAVRHVRWVFPASAALNIVMIYSAIPFGAHYLVDIFAGIMLAGLLIVLLRRWRGYVSQQSEQGRPNDKILASNISR